MRAGQIRDLTREEILIKKEELEKEVFNLRIRQVTKQLDNPLKMRTLGRELARIYTILHEDELGIRPLAGKGDRSDGQG